MITECGLFGMWLWCKDLGEKMRARALCSEGLQLELEPSPWMQLF